MEEEEEQQSNIEKRLKPAMNNASPDNNNNEEKNAAATKMKNNRNASEKQMKLQREKERILQITPESSEYVELKLPDDSPVTLEDVNHCTIVLEKLIQRRDIYESKNKACRFLRLAVEPYVNIQIKNRFGDNVPTYKGRNNTAARDAAGALQRKKAHDQRLINSRTLRRERLRQLKSLMETTSSSTPIPFIPDGAVFDGVNLSVGQSSGTSSVIGIQNGVEDLKNGVFTLEEGRKKEEEEEETAKRALDEDELYNPRSCYVCKCRFYKLHHFYDSLCPECAELNWTKRMSTADLSNKVCLLTGGRVKIGYQIALKLLRANATVIITTRFPADCAERLMREIDFQSWKHRVKLFGIDLRDLVAVEEFCALLNSKLDRLDVIINNACQTVRRPPAYYKHLLENEINAGGAMRDKFEGLIMDGSVHGLTNKPLILFDQKQPPPPAASSALLSQIPLLANDITPQDEALYPANVFDVNAQQIDLRSETTWTLKLDKVSTPEAVEVMAVNTLTPLIICARMKALMVRTGEKDLKSGIPDVGRYIVNVSSMEGKMYRHKDDVHPHTNMAKAALNMMTRTSAQDYVKSNIYMTAVDTGWLSNEAPLPKAAKIAETNWQTPIDEVDGASRVLDPVFSGIKETDPQKRMWGLFLKDYWETEW